MLLRKPILRSLAWFALLYLPLSLAAVFATPATAEALRTLARWVFSSPAGPRELTFAALPAPASRSHADTRIVIANRALLAPDGSGPVRNVDLPLGRIGTSAWALLGALTLATPISWPRRLRALALGFVLLLAMIFGVLASAIWLESTEVFLVTIRPSTLAVLRALQQQFLPHLGLVFPLLLWLLLTLRRTDAARLFADENATARPSAPPP